MNGWGGSALQAESQIFEERDETTAHQGHVPQIGAHSLRGTNAVSGVAGVGVVARGIGPDILMEHLEVILEATGGKDDGLGGMDPHLSVGRCCHGAHHATVRVGYQAGKWRLVQHFDAALVRSVLQHLPQLGTLVGEYIQVVVVAFGKKLEGVLGLGFAAVDELLFGRTD